MKISVGGTEAAKPGTVVEQVYAVRRGLVVVESFTGGSEQSEVDVWWDWEPVEVLTDRADLVTRVAPSEEAGRAY